MSFLLGPVLVEPSLQARESHLVRTTERDKVIMWRDNTDFYIGRKEMFYLTTHSAHFILRLYGVGHMVKDHSDCERGNPLPPHGLLFPINSNGSFICAIPQTG